MLGNGIERATQSDGDYLANSEGFFLKWVDGGDGPTGATPSEDNRIDAPVIYEHFPATDDEPELLRYWFFYGYDPKSDQTDVSGTDGWLKHQGDWEHIDVVLDDGRAQRVEYFGHGCVTGSYDWSEGIAPGGFEVVGGSHPIVYVAEGTHASYAFLREGGLGQGICGSQLKGMTDQTRFTSDSVTWSSWTGIGPTAAAAQCWYGYGGAWGNTGAVPNYRSDTTGPAGPPYNSGGWLESSADCDDALGHAVSIPDVAFGWLDAVNLSFEGGQPQTGYVVALESVPLRVATGSVAADGTASIEFAVPPGTPAGMHSVTIRSITGEDLYHLPIEVVIPPECVAGPNVLDLDGDLVTDDCDPNSLDGPLERQARRAARSSQVDRVGHERAAGDVDRIGDDRPVVDRPAERLAFGGTGAPSRSC